MIALDSSELIAFAATLLVRSTVLLAGALLAAQLLGRSSAAARHAFWSVTAVALLLLPWLPSALPRLPVPWPDGLTRWTQSAAEIWSTGAAPADPPAMPGTPPPFPTSSVREAVRAAPVLSSAVPSVTTRDSNALAAPVVGPSSARRASWLPQDLGSGSALLAMLLWAIGSVAAVASLGVALGRVTRVARSATPLSGRSWRESLERARVRVGVTRPVRLRSTPAAATALTGGVVRPYVLMPSRAAAWSEERRELVLLHELVHVARHDALRQIVARLAVALYWFHPLARIAARKALLAREEACDESVVALGLRPSVYARHLLDLAEPGELVLPALSLVERPQLEKRLMSILSDRPRSGRRTTLVAAACACLWALTVAASAPVQSSQRVPPVPQVAPVPAPRLAPAAPRAPQAAPSPAAPMVPALPLAPSVAPSVGALPLLAVPSVPPVLESRGAPELAPRADAAPSVPAVASAPSAPPRGVAPLAPAMPGVPSFAPVAPGGIPPDAAPLRAPTAPASPAVPAVPDAVFPWAMPVPSLLWASALPLPQERSCWEPGAGETSDRQVFTYTRSGVSGEVETFRIAGGDRLIRSDTGEMSVCMRAHGLVSFATDGTRIGSLGEGAWLVIGSRDAQRRVEMIVTQAAAGPQYLWYVNGAQRPMGTEAAEWRDAIVPVVAGYWELAEAGARSVVSAREARAVARLAIEQESLARRQQLEAMVELRTLAEAQELARRDQADTTRVRERVNDVQLEALQRALEAERMGRSEQMDSVRLMVERVSRELERVAAAGAAVRDSQTSAQLERARAEVQLTLAQRAELERSLQDAARAMDTRRDALVLEQRLRQSDGQLADQLRRLLEAMRRIP